MHVFDPQCLRQFRVWSFDSVRPKLVSPLGKYSWKKSDFYQFFLIEERGASEVSKIKFLKIKEMKIWNQNSNSWVKTIHIYS